MIVIYQKYYNFFIFAKTDIKNHCQNFCLKNNALLKFDVITRLIVIDIAPLTE